MSTLWEVLKTYKLGDWARVATCVSTFGVVVASVALLLARKQLNLNAKYSKAQVWLNLRKMFDDHREVHAKLRPCNQDANAQSQKRRCCWLEKPWPCCEDEWVKVEAYMGLFEHCEGLLHERVIDESTFIDIYSYRIKNIVSNNEIWEKKLKDKACNWLRFRDLAERCRRKDKRFPALPSLPSGGCPGASRPLWKFLRRVSR
jgi:hypothetical protein